MGVATFRRLVGNGVQWALGRPIIDRTLPDYPEVRHPDDAKRTRTGRQEKPWLAMDYGPFLSCVVGLPGGGPPRPETVVHKGIVQRLRTSAGEDGELTAVFDTDLLRWRCVWRGELALKGIVFDGPHGTFPEVDGDEDRGPHDRQRHQHRGQDPRDDQGTNGIDAHDAQRVKFLAE